MKIFYKIFFTLFLVSSCHTAHKKIQLQNINNSDSLVYRTIKFNEGQLKHHIYYNEPYYFFKTNGIYLDYKNQFDKNIKNLNWDEFTIYFEFYANSNREQWPIMMSKSHRALGVMLNTDGSISITANNQNDYYKTKGFYYINQWHAVKIIKKGIETSVFLDDKLIGKHDITFHKDVYKNDKNISSANYANGIAFKGGLRNIIVFNETDIYKTKQIIAKNKSFNIDENILFKREYGFYDYIRIYNILGFDWNSFEINFDYNMESNKNYMPFIIGDNFEIIKFGLIENKVFVSINNGRTIFKTNYEILNDTNYFISLRKINKNLILYINNKEILYEKIDLKFKDVLSNNANISNFDKKNPNFDHHFNTIKNIKISKNIKSVKKSKNPQVEILKTNHIINDKNEGLIFYDLTHSLRSYKGVYSNNLYDSENAYIEHIKRFNWNSFSLGFEFISNFNGAQILVQLGQHPNSPIIELWIQSNSEIYLKSNENIIYPIKQPTISSIKFNTVFFKYNKNKLEVYINNQLCFNSKINIPKNIRMVNKASLSTLNIKSKSAFNGKLRNINIYEYSSNPF
mgnify:CR=1 FL=1